MVNDQEGEEVVKPNTSPVPLGSKVMVRSEPVSEFGCQPAPSTVMA
jgi:hypothetical protein